MGSINVVENSVINIDATISLDGTTGVITATSYEGDGSALTNINVPSIASTTNLLVGDGSGNVSDAGYAIGADGTDGQILKTDGNGNLSFIDIPAPSIDSTVNLLAGDGNGNAVDAGYTIGSDGTNGQVLKTDGGGNLSFISLPTIPTKTSDLTNDSGFITSASVPTIDSTTNLLKGDGDGNASNSGYTIGTDGTSGQILSTNGSGSLSFVDNNAAPGWVASSQGDVNLSGFTNDINTITTDNMVWNEELTGTLDGSNDTFTISNSPAANNYLMLFKNGLLQKYSDDFTLSGATITFVSENIPQVGDHLYATYYY